ncbi:MAG: hypothetical protein ACC707_02565 [Thiohalomonadales bacterium]
MLNLLVFTDGSVDTKLKVGYGAYLLVSDLSASINSLKDTVKVQRFEQTSSTTLELQTLLSQKTQSIRDPTLSEGLAVRSEYFVEQVKGHLGNRANYRSIKQSDEPYFINETELAYSDDSSTESSSLR